MSTLKKYIICCRLFILLWIVCTVISCDNSNKPMPFDKDKWLECGGSDVERNIFIEGNTRYRMSLWLEENYNFCDKSSEDILEKLCKCDSLTFEEAKHSEAFKIPTKQYNPNFIFGIDPWIDTDWIGISFDTNRMVSKVYYFHYDYKTKEVTKREICANN